MNDLPLSQNHGTSNIWYLILPCALIHLGKKLYTNTQYFGLSSMFIFSYHMVLKYPDICTCILPISSKFLREKWKLNNGFHSLQGTKQCVDVCQKLYPVLQQAVAKAVEDRLSSDHVTWPIIPYSLYSTLWSFIYSLCSVISIIQRTLIGSDAVVYPGIYC